MTARTIDEPPRGPDELPRGLVVELGERVRAEDGGRTLVGGAPARLLRLSAGAARLLDGRRLTADDATSTRLAELLLARGLADPVIAGLPPVDPALLTVVVPVRDRPAELERLLAGLGTAIGVIVVDDCSRDPAATRDVAGRHGVELVALPRNLGPAGARNAGLARVRTPFVAFIDSDIVVTSEALALLARHLHLPRVAAVAPRIHGLSTGGNWIARYEDARSALDLGPVAGLVRPRSPIGWVPGACLVARVAALGGGFAEQLRVAEDVDLVWRLTARGWQVRHEPAVAARHDHRVRLGAWLGRRAYYGTGAAVLAERHPGAVAPAVLTPANAGTMLALLAQRWWSLPVAAAGFTIQSARLARRLPADPPRGRGRLAARLVGRGLVGTAEQTGALMLRHWWPPVLAGCLRSRRLRRAVLAAAVLDGLLDHRRHAPDLDPARFVLARRLDDLAYGAGVWAGALRRRSVRPLLPARPTPRAGERGQ